MKQEEAAVAFFEQDAHSFVIRVWREKREVVNAAAEWRGWVDHVQSGQRHYFQGREKLHEIMSTYLSSVPDVEEVIAAIQSHERENS